MSNGKGLAVAGLILGLIGAGLGGYVFFDNILGLGLDNGGIPSERRTYYVEDIHSSVSLTSAITPLPGMNISFTTTQTMKLYVLFTCYARIFTQDGDIVRIYLYLNELSMTPASYYIDAFGYDAPYERYDVSMQAYNNSLPPGTYNITVRVNVDHTSTLFGIPALFVDIYS